MKYVKISISIIALGIFNITSVRAGDETKSATCVNSARSFAVMLETVDVNGKNYAYAGGAEFHKIFRGSSLITSDGKDFSGDISVHEGPATASLEKVTTYSDSQTAGNVFLLTRIRNSSDADKATLVLRTAQGESKTYDDLICSETGMFSVKP